MLNQKRLSRLYREERLMVRRRGRCKRALGTRAPILLPRASNQRWSLDFLSDTLSDGRRFRILYIVDDFSCECLGARQADAKRFIETFNSKLRDACLNEHVFLSLAEARQTIQAWRYDYNHLRGTAASMP